MAAIEQAVRETLKSHVDGIELAVWFGSTARGEAAPLSDVDVAVHFRPGLDADERFRLRTWISGELWERLEGREVDVVDLQDAPIALAYRVLRDGRLVACRDEGFWKEFQVRVWNLYFDLRPLWDLQCDYMKRQILEGSYLG